MPYPSLLLSVTGNSILGEPRGRSIPVRCAYEHLGLRLGLGLKTVIDIISTLRVNPFSAGRRQTLKSKDGPL